jgi:hypothetical protein
MSSKTNLLAYLGAALAAVLAIVGVYFSVQSFEDTEEGWADVIAQVEKLGTSAQQAEAVSIEQEDFVVCVATKSAGALLGGVQDSLRAASEGTCRLPSVSADVSACVPFAEKVPEGKNVPAAVEVSIAPVLGIVAGLVDKAKSEKVRAWAKGVLAWVGSGKGSIVALIENPASGKFELAGVDIEGCNI